jgi:hypothetical protein
MKRYTAGIPIVFFTVALMVACAVQQERNEPATAAQSVDAQMN